MSVLKSWTAARFSGERSSSLTLIVFRKKERERKGEEDEETQEDREDKESFGCLSLTAGMIADWDLARARPDGQMGFVQEPVRRRCELEDTIRMVGGQSPLALGDPSLS